MIDQDHLDLAAIVRIDRAGRMQHGDSVLGGEPRTWPYLRLVAGRQCDRESRRHQREFAGGKRLRIALGNGGHQVETGGLGRLVGRQRQAFGMGEALQFDRDFRAQDAGSRGLSVRLFATCPTRSIGTCFLVIPGEESTAISPSSPPLLRLSRCTVLRSPPITPVAGETSLATIQSQPLRASLALALSMRCSVSAAKPITSGGRLSPSFEIVARMSGFSTS